MPANIEGMVKQYSKITIVKPNKNFNILSGKLTITENVNCSFTPKRAIASLEYSHILNYKMIIDSNKGYHYQPIIEDNGTYASYRCNCTIRGKTVNIDLLETYPDDYDIPIKLEEILLIG